MHCLQLKNQVDNEEISPQNVHDVDEKYDIFIALQWFSLQASYTVASI